VGGQTAAHELLTAWRCISTGPQSAMAFLTCSANDP